MSLLKRWKTSVYRETEDETAAELNIEEKKTDVIEKILRWKKTGRGQPPAYLNFVERTPPSKKLHGNQTIDLNY